MGGDGAVFFRAAMRQVRMWINHTYKYYSFAIGLNLHQYSRRPRTWQRRLAPGCRGLLIMNRKTFHVLAGLLFVAGLLNSLHAAPVQGWLAWRGPEQSGVSRETGLPDKVDPKSPLWRTDFPGQSTPVIANGKLYIMGYLGEGADLQEGVACFDAETGKKLWQQLYNDFISDTIYLRYATASPAIDPESGNVFVQGTQGILAGFTPDGKLIWKKSLMATSSSHAALLPTGVRKVRRATASMPSTRRPANSSGRRHPATGPGTIPSRILTSPPATASACSLRRSVTAA